jgi:hypothetical protein
MKPDPDTILVWEIQGNPTTRDMIFRPEDFDIYSKAGDGYRRYRRRDEDEGLCDTKG